MNTRRLIWAALLLAACSESAPPEATIRVTIPQGATLTSVSELLLAHKIIDSPKLFRTYARFTGRGRAIQAGVFELAPGMSTRRVLDVLVSGQTALDVLVVQEGLMLREVAPEVERQLHIPADSVLAAASDPTLLARVRVPTETLEGYLYPSTYFVRAGAGAAEVVEQMVVEFESRWKPAWSARLDSLGFTRHEIVTLASIIEGEVRHPEDSRYVSSVYHNRLRRRMRLQADPTVVYALGERRRLFERDYEVVSAFNTYRITGLPPSPIGQPSEGSIEAALYPVRTDFLYFVAGPDGKHVFSRTYREHLATIRTVRRAASANSAGAR
jgi:UPF0755 protein